MDGTLLKWLKQCQSSDFPVSGPILKGILQNLVLNLHTPMRLIRFKARHSISFTKVCDEAKIIDINLTNNRVLNT